MKYYGYIDSHDYDTLEELSEQTQRPMDELMSDAIADLKKRLVSDATNHEYKHLQQDEDAWQAEIEEREAWDGTTDVNNND